MVQRLLSSAPPPARPPRFCRSTAKGSPKRCSPKLARSLTNSDISSPVEEFLGHLFGPAAVSAREIAPARGGVSLNTMSAAPLYVCWKGDASHYVPISAGAWHSAKRVGIRRPDSFQSHVFAGRIRRKSQRTFSPVVPSSASSQQPSFTLLLADLSIGVYRFAGQTRPTRQRRRHGRRWPWR